MTPTTLTGEWWIDPLKSDECWSPYAINPAPMDYDIELSEYCIAEGMEEHWPSVIAYAERHAAEVGP